MTNTRRRLPPGAKWVTLPSKERRVELVADVGIDPATGKRKQTRRRYRTVEDAIEAYNKIKRESREGTYVGRSGRTLKQVCEDWLAGRRGIRPTTLAGYRNWLKPVIAAYGEMPVQKLTKRHLDDLVPLLQAGKLRRSDGHSIRPWSARSINAMLGVLDQVLADAVKQGLMSRNVAELVDRLGQTRKERDTYTAAKVKKVLAAARHDRFEVAWHLALYGLRRGEIAGLRWSDIDVNAKTLTIDLTRVTVDGHVACHGHGTGVSRVLPGSWDHLVRQSWDRLRVVRWVGRVLQLLIFPGRSIGGIGVAFREVRVVEVREVLRCWLAGEGLRTAAERAGVDRKTARRYVDAAVALGLVRDGGEGQLSDELLGAVVAAVRPVRQSGHGAAWEALLAVEEQIRDWVGKDGLQLTNVHGKLTRCGVVVPYRTLHRFAVERCGFGRRQPTVRVADGQPGVECQLDFGRLGLVPDPGAGRRRVCHALIFTAVYSRHMFVWLSFAQTLTAVVAGCEAAWAWFGGVYRVLIPDNMAAVVADADPVNPTFTVGWLDYAQHCGFGTDPARVRHAKDKPRVERSVPYVRESFFRGETFVDLADAQRRVEAWCAGTAGLRVHGTTAARPAEVFAAEEAPLLLPVPATAYDVPIFATPKVARDRLLLTELAWMFPHVSGVVGVSGSTVPARDRRRGAPRSGGVGRARRGVVAGYGQPV